MTQTKERGFMLVCETCKKEFIHSHSHTKTCSEECRVKRFASTYHRESSYQNLSSGTVGAVTELEIASELMKKGYAVFRALSQSCFCDLIAIKNEEFLKLECRTGYISITGKVSFPNRTHGTISGFAVYVPTEDKTYYYKEDAKTPLEI